MTGVSAGSALDSGKAWLRERVERGLHPIDGVERDAALSTIAGLAGLEPEPWTAAWGGLAEDYARQARAATEPAERHHLWWQAYQAAFLGRYPVPNHPLKAALYDRAREYFLEATRLEEPRLEAVEVPFAGRPGEGDTVRFYLTRPAGVERPRVVLAWGGIDTWKEESHARLGGLLRSRGLAVVLVDIPGTGESPVLASVDAERQYTPVFEYLAERSDIDGARCAVVGASFGGYWAMKLAYTHRDHVAAAVNWGGGVHITFTPEWQHRSRNASSYLMDLMAARARIFGGTTFEDYVAHCPELSLLDQGLLEAPSSPILLVNGRDDQQNSIDDLYLSLDHGDPKAARVFDGGHMGQGPTGPTIADWVQSQLA
jgi:esterase FrsA